MNNVRLQCSFFLFFLLLSFIASEKLLAQNSNEFMGKAMRNDINGVKELIASGTDINQQNEAYGHTALIIACNYDYVDLAKLLISEGADINIRGNDGSTALIAAGSNSQELVEILISKGADVKAKMVDGTGVFTQCINGILMESVSIQLAEILLSNGADINESATTGPVAGYTPLMIATRNNKPELVNFLILNGSDVNARSMDGSTALSLAVQKGYQDIIDVLKSNGAK
jgi:ankyrin repeat protein